MVYNSSGVGDGFDLLTLQLMIECFIDTGESGPHSIEGWALSHILNHCHANNLSFTLTFVPHYGYYVKSGIADGIIPEEMKPAFGM